VRGQRTDDFGFVASFQFAVHALILHASERGEATPTVRQILGHIIAPLYYHVVFALEIDDDYAQRLVRDVLAMVR
jgi:hypothetical protein